MPKLTDTQFMVLSAAAQRRDGAILPLPASLTINKGAIASVLKSLVKRGLVAEQPADPNDDSWRESTGGRRVTLFITDVGLQGLGSGPDEAPKARTGAAESRPIRTAGRKRRNHTPATPKAESEMSTPTVGTGTKQALLIDLLKRKGGATTGEIVEATGWQAHSVRGAISGTLKNKLGFTVSSEAIEDRGRVYRITGTV